MRTWSRRWAPRGVQRICLFDHVLADDLVDRGLGERGGDGLACLLAFLVVGDPLGVGADVAVSWRSSILMAADSCRTRGPP